MAREEKICYQVQMTEGKWNITHQLLIEYGTQSTEDIQKVPKNLQDITIMPK